MTPRTTSRTVTFTRPFLLSGFDGAQPAGTYTVETDEEPVDGLSFLVHRRVATLIHLPAQPRAPRVVQTVSIDPAELDLALLRDAAPGEAPTAIAAPADPDNATARAAQGASVQASRRGIWARLFDMSSKGRKDQ